MHAALICPTDNFGLEWIMLVTKRRRRKKTKRDIQHFILVVSSCTSPDLPVTKRAYTDRPKKKLSLDLICSRVSDNRRDDGVCMVER